MEKVVKSMEDYRSGGPTDVFRLAAKEWASWLLENCSGERLRLGMDISISIVNYLNWDEKEDDAEA